MILIGLLVVFSLHAETLVDQKLSGYVEKFQLRSLRKPTNINRPLVELGHSLFRDVILSGNKNISCLSCHHPRNMTMDGLPLGLGEGAIGIQIPGSTRAQNTGKILARNTPGLFNLNGINVMFWDGRVSYNPKNKNFTTPVPLRKDVNDTLTSALAAQALFPMVNHDEMRGAPGSNPIADAKSEEEAWDLLTERVLAVPRYKDAFTQIYPNQTINAGHLAEALAEFQRVNFFFADTPYDNYLDGDLTALNDLQKRGMDVFFSHGKCGQCHNGEHLSNFEFHSIGAPQIGPGKVNGDDLGRYEWEKTDWNYYAFRVPPLRNVFVTPPFMHDGSLKSLSEVVKHYNDVKENLTAFTFVNEWTSYTEKLSGHDHANDALRLQTLSYMLDEKLDLSESDEKALVEFLTTGLTDKKLLPVDVL